MQHCDKTSKDEIELQAQLVHVDRKMKCCDYKDADKAA